MTARGRVLEHHTLVVRDGRIVDLLPTADAVERYAAAVAIHRPGHLLMPGMISTHTCAALSLLRARSSPTPGLEANFVGPEFVRDGVLAGIAEMLVSGITCFADRCYFPEETARVAGEQGMRAVIGLPVAETASLWAKSASEYLTQGLRVRDEFAGHPLISTVFAPHAASGMSNGTLSRIVTLADELDAGIVIDLHRSEAEIAQSVAVHGMRPIARLWQLGMLTPALTAVHMTHASAADVETRATDRHLHQPRSVVEPRVRAPIPARCIIHPGRPSPRTRHRRRRVPGAGPVERIEALGPHHVERRRLGCPRRGHTWQRRGVGTRSGRRVARAWEMG